MGNVDVSIFFVRVLIISIFSIFGPSCSLIFPFVFLFDLLLDPGRRLSMFEVEAMLVIPHFDLLIERLRPILVVTDIIGDLIIFRNKFFIDLLLHIFLVACNDVVVE